MCEQDRNELLLQTVIQHLNEHDVRFAQVPEKHLLFLPFSLKQATYLCLLGVDQEIFRLYTSVGCHAPEEKRREVAELLGRINWGLVIGNFEMDFADGEIRFRTILDLRACDLTDGMVEATIRTNLTTVERFHPAIMSVLWNDTSPEDALALVMGPNAG